MGFKRVFMQVMEYASAFLFGASVMLAIINASEHNWDSFALNIVTLVANGLLFFFWRRELEKDEAGAW